MLHLVEISPALQRLQQQTAGRPRCADALAQTLRDVPAGPSLIVANEFIDALPVHQAVKQADGWHERVVEVGADGNCYRRGARAAPLFRNRRCRAACGSRPKARSSNGAPTDRARNRPARAQPTARR